MPVWHSDPAVSVVVLGSLTEIEKAADAHGISHRTLVIAKDQLGLVVEKERGVANGPWFWRLPDMHW